VTLVDVLEDTVAVANLGRAAFGLVPPRADVPTPGGWRRNSGKFVRPGHPRSAIRLSQASLRRARAPWPCVHSGDGPLYAAGRACAATLAAQLSVGMPCRKRSSIRPFLVAARVLLVLSREARSCVRLC
jgi:hypothetical protein